jgi:hypothetical protein
MITGAFMPTSKAPPYSSGSRAPPEPQQVAAQQKAARVLVGSDRSMVAADGAQDGLRRALDGLERHVAGEAVGDDHVDQAVHDVAAFDVAVEAHALVSRR